MGSFAVESCVLALVTPILPRLKASWLQTWSVSQEAATAHNSLTELLIKLSSINFTWARKHIVGIDISDKSWIVQVFMYGKFSAQTYSYWVHIPIRSSQEDYYATIHMLRLMTDFPNSKVITHFLELRKGLSDYRVGNDSTVWATELCFYCHAHSWEKKIPSAVAGFHFHIWQASLNDTVVSRPARKQLGTWADLPWD